MTRTNERLPMQQPSLPSAPAPQMPAGSQVRVIGLPESPTAIHRAFRAQRDELSMQLETLQESRRELSRQSQQALIGADRTGVERHITEIDARITTLDTQIAAADAEVAKSAAVPGAVVPDPPRHRDAGVFLVSGMFIVVVFLPLTIAYARRIWRRSSATISALPHELMDRLTRLDQAVDSIAVEVERIGEGQRFVTRLFAERPAEAIGAAHRQAQPMLDEPNSRR